MFYLPLQIITTDEAEKRGHLYDRQGSTYLFDLDYVEDVYTVDAAHQGNISHFVNHSVSVCSHLIPTGYQDTTFRVAKVVIGSNRLWGRK